MPLRPVVRLIAEPESHSAHHRLDGRGVVGFLVGVDDGKDLQTLGVGHRWLVRMVHEERGEIIQRIPALIGAVVGGVHLDRVALSGGYGSPA